MFYTGLCLSLQEGQATEEEELDASAEDPGEDDRSTIMISSEGDQGEDSAYIDLDSEASEAQDLASSSVSKEPIAIDATQGEQVRRGPQDPSGGLSPEVLEACSRAHLVGMGVVPPTSGHPAVTTPAPFSSFTSSGGGQVRPSRSGRGSLPRGAFSTSTLSSIPATPAVPASSTGGDAPGAASPSGKVLSSREKKKARGFIAWDPSQDQLMHAQLLLRGGLFYKMDTPICLSITDPRMVGFPPYKKWLCAYCPNRYSSQLDCQGHTLSAHSHVRSPSLCGCRVSVFNSAKALWDHLSLMHNIDVRKLKNSDPPRPWLKSNTRQTR